MKSQALLILLAASSALAQGTFQNLDFESANIPINPGLYIPFNNALPGWTGSLGPYSATEAAYNEIAGGFATVSIIDGSSRSYSNSVIDGNYTAAISAGFAGTSFVATAVSQTAQTPVTARSLIFTAQSFSSISALKVTFAGQDIPFFLLGSGENFQTYGADISPFAGMTGELRFSENPTFTHVTTTVLLDNIQFSDVAIPEPSVLTLSGLSTLLLTWRFLRQPRP